MDASQSRSWLGPALIIIIALWVVSTFGSMLIPAMATPALSLRAPLILLMIFAFLHGAGQYGIIGSFVFFVIAVITGNVFENMSIMTGFPFGNYHHNEMLGPKLFLVPLVVGPAFYGVSYLGWRLAATLLGTDLSAGNALAKFGLPIVASLVTVAWDICLDPLATTFAKFTTYEQGGGYFGVPLSNYAGWFLTVWVIFQLFALVWRPSWIGRRADSPSLLYLPPVFWTLMALQYPVLWLTGAHFEVHDEAGTLWRSQDFYETAVMMSVYGMMSISVTTMFAIASRKARGVN